MSEIPVRRVRMLLLFDIIRFWFFESTLEACPEGFIQRSTERLSSYGQPFFSIEKPLKITETSLKPCNQHKLQTQLNRLSSKPRPSAHKIFVLVLLKRFFSFFCLHFPLSVSFLRACGGGKVVFFVPPFCNRPPYPISPPSPFFPTELLLPPRKKRIWWYKK